MEKGRGKSVSQNSNLALRFSRLKQNKLIIHSSSSMEFLLFYSSKSRSQVRILRQYVEHGLLDKPPLFGKGYEDIFPAVSQKNTITLDNQRDTNSKGSKLKNKQNQRHIRGTQLPNLSGNSEMRSSLILSLSGPSTITGLVYCNSCCTTASYDRMFSSARAL